MATYGIQYFGIYIPVSEDEPVIKGYVYEDIRKYNGNIPPDKYFELLTQLRDTIDNSGYGIKTQFIEVNGNLVRVQWKQVGSPITSVGTIIQLIAVCVGVYIAALGLSQLAHQVYRIISVLGSETVSSIIQILLLIVVLSFVSSLIPRFKW